MDKIIPNGTEVLIFYDFKGQSRGANEREFVKGVVVNSRESNDLSYHGSAWYEQIYNVIDEMVETMKQLMEMLMQAHSLLEQQNIICL